MMEEFTLAGPDAHAYKEFARATVVLHSVERELKEAQDKYKAALNALHLSVIPK